MKKIRIPLSVMAVSLLVNPCAVSSTAYDLSPWLIPFSGNNTSVLYQSGRPADEHRISFVNGFNTVEIKFDGDIQVGDDDRSVRSISPGGYLTFSMTTFGNKRELTISSDNSGRLSYEYYEGRSEVPFEPDGRKWMEDVLLDVIRSSGIDSEGRTNRIYGKSGLEGFIDEMEEIGSNSVKRLYFSALLSGHTLTNRELKIVAESITRTMSSDSERGRLFREYSELFLRDNEVAASYFSAISRLSSNSERSRIYRNIDAGLDFSEPVLVDAYFQGIDRMSSNSERGNVLRHTLDTKDMTVNAYVSLFNSVGRISSSSESGRVIRTTDKLNLDDREVAEACFAAIDRISSNSEKSSALRHIIGRNVLGEQAMVSYLKSCRGISSSSEKSRVLTAITDIDLAESQVIRDQYFNTVNSISSDSESGRVLRYTLENHELDGNSMRKLLESVARLSSSSEKGSVLRAAIPHLIHEQAVLDAFFKAVNTTSSSTEQGRILRDLVERGKLDNRVITSILNSARTISSNSEKGSVLRAVASKIPKENSSLRDLYMETAKSLSSDSEYRRAVEALM